MLSITALTMALSMGDDEVVVTDTHGVYGMGLPLVKCGLSLSVREIATRRASKRGP